jgi:pyruvate formate lyase activating enzyme
MLPIKGLQKTCLIDYPPYTSTVIFLGGCNFRCPFCQNAGLVLSPDSQPTITEQMLFDFLEQRRKWLDAVVISGGEPTLYKDLPEFCRKLKAMGFLVKLDTNGTNPEMLKSLIEEKLVDFVAMDVKSAEKGYTKAAGTSPDMGKIKESISILMKAGAGSVGNAGVGGAGTGSSGTDHAFTYEFRTTAVPGINDSETFEGIGQWLKGAARFSLQQFRPKECIDENYNSIKPFAREDLNKFKEILEKYIVKVEIKNA